MDRFESLVERQIREAQERGEFDNLPGAGKPLPRLDGVDDPDWWVRRLVQREGLDMTDALPPVIALRKEAAGFPHTLLDLRTEESVRAVLEDYNRRVKLDRLRPRSGPSRRCWPEPSTSTAWPRSGRPCERSAWPPARLPRPHSPGRQKVRAR